MPYYASYTAQEASQTYYSHRIKQLVSNDLMSIFPQILSHLLLFMFHSSNKDALCASQLAAQMQLPEVPASYQSMNKFF